MGNAAKKVLAGSIIAQGWDHDGQTVVTHDPQVGLRTAVDYEAMITYSTPIDVDLNEEVVYDWMKTTNRMN